MVPNKHAIRRLMQHYIDEDIGPFDLGECDNAVISSEIVIKQHGAFDGHRKMVMCGGVFVKELFEELTCSTLLLAEEGEIVEPGRVIVQVIGKASDVLNGERVALNILARCMGIAGKTKLIVDHARDRGWKGVIAGTRKTTPGFRLCEKYAVYMGGGDPHRYGLHDMCMIKDNHLDIHSHDHQSYVMHVKQGLSFTTKLEVEVSSLELALAAAEQGTDIVMFDNVTPSDAKEWSDVVKSRHPNILLEVSGGITMDNIDEYLHDNIDIVSMGALTQQCPLVDLSMRIILE